MNATVPILAFAIGQQAYALRIADVVEVAAMVDVLAIPYAPTGVLGMVNRHGEMIALLDMRVILGSPVQRVGANTIFIVAEYEGQRMGLVVDSIDLVKYVSLEAFHPVPQNTYINAIVQDHGQVWQMLAAAPLFEYVLP